MLSRERSATTIEQARKELGTHHLRATSAGRGWSSIAVDEFGEHFADDMLAPPRDHHVVTLAIQSSAYVYQNRMGKTFESPCQAGEITMLPAGHETRWRGLLPNNLCMRLTTEKLREACDDLRKFGGETQAELLNSFRVRDPVLQNLGGIIRLELARHAHPAQTLLMEAVATAITAHIVAHYTNFSARPERAAPVLNAAALRRVVSIARDGTEASLQDLADAAGLSRFHFARLFKKETGISPMRYLEQSRIEKAKTLVREGNLSLAQVGASLGFADQSHFTRRFKRYAGCTPAAYARRNRDI